MTVNPFIGTENANNVVIFRQTLAPGQTNDALVATDQTPDTY